MSVSEYLANVDIPLGLKSLIRKCHELYPDQPNPLQITAVVKYWLGGGEPLDYISMYLNKGDANVPPHWHYISFGLSDLHGDGRVHLTNHSDRNGENKSGMGFELTFRLIKRGNDNLPPIWPSRLLQNLARYCFQTGNRFCPGDNIPWRKSLDGSRSKIEHLLISEDEQLKRVETPHGWVEFCQIVGVTEEELEHASCWNGKGVLNLLKRDKKTGGELLITDMSRDKSVFELFPDTLLHLQNVLEKEGSDLAGINAEFKFCEIHNIQNKNEFDATKIKIEPISDMYSDENFNINSEINAIQIKNEFDSIIKIEAENSNDENVNNSSGGGGGNASSSDNYVKLNFNNIKNNSDLNDKNFHALRPNNNSLQRACPVNNSNMPSTNVISLEGIEIILAPYAAKFLLLAIKDRVKHGRHFTFKAHNMALTFLAETVTGSVVSKTCPYGVIGPWIQVMITEDLIPRMIESFKDISNNNVFEWSDKNLRIIINDLLQKN